MIFPFLRERAVEIAEEVTVSMLLRLELLSHSELARTSNRGSKVVKVEGKPEPGNRLSCGVGSPTPCRVMHSLFFIIFKTQIPQPIRHTHKQKPPKICLYLEPSVMFNYFMVP